MPNVDGKKFPYTAAGKAAAKRAMGMKKGGLASKKQARAIKKQLRPLR